MTQLYEIAPLRWSHRYVGTPDERWLASSPCGDLIIKLKEGRFFVQLVDARSAMGHDTLGEAKEWGQNIHESGLVKWLTKIKDTQ